MGQKTNPNVGLCWLLFQNHPGPIEKFLIHIRSIISTPMITHDHFHFFMGVMSCANFFSEAKNITSISSDPNQT